MAKDIEIVLGAKDQATAVLQKLSAETQQVGRNVQRMAAQSAASSGRMATAFNGLKTAAKPLLAAFAAFKSVQATGKLFLGVSEAANVQAEAERGLAKALELSTSKIGPTIEQHKQWASALQGVTNVGDEVTLGLMRQATMLGVSNANLQDVTRSAIGLSEATGMSLDEALRKVNETINGNDEALAEHIPSLRNMSSAEEQLAAVSKLASDGLAQRADRTKTAVGAAERLSNAWGDFQEVIGKTLEPVKMLVASGLSVLVETIQTAVIPAIESMMPSADKISEMMTKMRDVIVRSVTFAEVVITNLPKIWEGVKARYLLHLTTISENTKHILTKVIPAYTVWFGENFTSLLGDAFNLAKTVITNFAETAKDVISKMWTFINSRGEEGAPQLVLSLTKAMATDFKKGFEAQTEPLPEIMERQLTDGEKKLMATVAGVTGDIATEYAKKMAERMGGVGSDAGAAMLEGINLAATQAGQIGYGVKQQLSSLQAVQGRLLTRGPGANPLLEEAKKQTKAAEQIAKNTDPANKPVGTGNVLQLEPVG